MIPLDLFLVYDEKTNNIPMQPLVDFIVEYNNRYQNTGIALDEERQDGQYFWEVIWEIVRRREFPEAFSRLDSCFAFTNKNDADNFAKEIRQTNKEPAELIPEGAKIQMYDMQWITDVPENSTMNEAVDYARNYWKGLKTNNPVMEALVYGNYTLIEKQED